MSQWPTLLLATGNRAKAREYARLLEGIPWQLTTLADLGIDTEVSETGATFEENAAMKARAYAAQSGLTTLADDSGLEVDALGGEPGVRSARYAGEGATDRERIHYLLDKLAGVPRGERAARFVCVIAIAAPDGEVTLCRGECPGVITVEPEGEHGFGYDPVFYLPALGKTMAQLSMEEKNELSHRGQAAWRARDALEALARRPQGP